MPYKEKEVKKKYWTIGEVGNLLGCYTSKIRFFEDEDLLGKVKRSRISKKRKYTTEQVQRIEKILYAREFGMSIERIRTTIHLGYFNELVELNKSLEEKYERL